MNISFSFRNIDSSNSIKTYTQNKLHRIEKYLRLPLQAQVTISMERHLHIVTISFSEDGNYYSAREESEDMYASIDLCIDKINRQIRKTKKHTG